MPKCTCMCGPGESGALTALFSNVAENGYLS